MSVLTPNWQVKGPIRKYSKNLNPNIYQEQIF